TRFSRDWSSDVCSSDLRLARDHDVLAHGREVPWPPAERVRRDVLERAVGREAQLLEPVVLAHPDEQPLTAQLDVRGEQAPTVRRSEERRVGKGCRTRRS